MEKVKTLLLGTNQNLTQIAAMTGFSDPKYMSKDLRMWWAYCPQNTAK